MVKFTNIEVKWETVVVVEAEQADADMLMM